MESLRYSKLTAGQFTGLSTFQFLAFIRRAIFYTFLSIFLKMLGLGTTETTLMATVGMIANTGAQVLLWGPLLDRFWASKAFVVIGEAVAGLGHVVLFYLFRYVYDTGSHRLAGYVIIFGLGFIEVWWSMSNVGWSTLMSELTDIRERRRLLGQLSVVGGIGGIVGATLGGLLFRGGGGFIDGVLFIIPAVIMILSAILVWLAIKVENRAHEKKESNNLSIWTMERDVLTVYIVFIIALVFINFGRNSIAIITSLYLYEPTGIGASDIEVSNFRNISSVATILAGTLIGSSVSRRGDYKVLALGVLFSFLSVIILAATHVYYVSLVAAALIGSAQVIIQASSYSIVAEIAPEEFRGRLFSIYNATFFLSWGIAATLVTGPTSDFFISVGYSTGDSYRMSFLAAALLIGIGGVILFFSSKLKKRRFVEDLSSGLQS